ncbi:type II secretion system protein M [Wenzhouxiangella sp. AB-CW3]|uniref:type II secretion system protein GspM n=1 Tax=Wenzhouxiangella sp. AB-CW3 TaxID=2771012 RepID=UPI00168BFC9F|nr:type II secretion system protein M [Wenzhouxiangella sp. AB-CW3]QOC23141.1 type II secretion system protein M [Wenzhouxiangella sp. AB-CW3]
MIEYWQQLNPRQRRVLGLAGVVLGALLLYVWVWEPLHESRAVERERVAGQQALLDWLDAVAPMTEQLRQTGERATSLEGRSLLGLADETAREAGLAGALSRIEPAGERQVRVWLDGADFVSAMGWLEQLSRSYPIRVSQLQVDRARARGQVNVRVTLVADA